MPSNSCGTVAQVSTNVNTVPAAVWWTLGSRWPVQPVVNITLVWEILNQMAGNLLRPSYHHLQTEKNRIEGVQGFSPVRTNFSVKFWSHDYNFWPPRPPWITPCIIQTELHSRSSAPFRTPVEAIRDRWGVGLHPIMPSAGQVSLRWRLIYYSALIRFGQECEQRFAASAASLLRQDVRIMRDWNRRQHRAPAAAQLTSSAVV